jgi:hypothetical protein
MEWQLTVAIAVLVPIFLLPAAIVWYMNVTGIFEVMKDRRERQKREGAGRRKAAAVAK